MPITKIFTCATSYAGTSISISLTFYASAAARAVDAATVASVAKRRQSSRHRRRERRRAQWHRARDVTAKRPADGEDEITSIGTLLVNISPSILFGPLPDSARPPLSRRSPTTDIYPVRTPDTRSQTPKKANNSNLTWVLLIKSVHTKR